MGLLDGIQGWLQGLFSSGKSAPTGDPVSRAGDPGVSAFHAWWQGMPTDDPVVSVAATLKVVICPAGHRLHFWAMQASFDPSPSPTGAHIGLQWNDRHPGNTAVNWGGYGNVSDVGSVLAGSTSTLPSTPSDPNTRDYPWQVGVGYRFTIARTDGVWRGTVTDTSTGTAVAIRDLQAPGDHLSGFVVWAEVFDWCDMPPTEVVWSDFEALTASGTSVKPDRVSLSFPPDAACPNTNITIDADGVHLWTGVQRTALAGSVVNLVG
jgi:hypothetical protein